MREFPTMFAKMGKFVKIGIVEMGREISSAEWIFIRASVYHSMICDFSHRESYLNFVEELRRKSEQSSYIPKEDIIHLFVYPVKRNEK